VHRVGELKGGNPVLQATQGGFGLLLDTQEMSHFRQEEMITFKAGGRLE